MVSLYEPQVIYRPIFLLLSDIGGTAFARGKIMCYGRLLTCLKVPMNIYCDVSKKWR